MVSEGGVKMFSASSFVIGAVLGFATTALFYKYREIEQESKIFFLKSEMEAQEGYVDALETRLARLEEKEAQNVQ
jgi:hypothetical protein